MMEQSASDKSQAVTQYVSRMAEVLQRRRDFEGAGKSSPSALKQMAEELVRADRSKRMRFDAAEAKKSSCPGCGNKLGDFPYHLRDGRVLCNSCGVEASTLGRVKQHRY